jgi:hypothetical protein
MPHMRHEGGCIALHWRPVPTKMSACKHRPCNLSSWKVLQHGLCVASQVLSSKLAKSYCCQSASRPFWVLWVMVCPLFEPPRVNETNSTLAQSCYRCKANVFEDDRGSECPKRVGPVPRKRHSHRILPLSATSKALTYRMICHENHSSRRIGENRRRRTVGPTVGSSRRQ